MLAPDTTQSAGPFDDIRAAVRALCAQFPGPYWQERDRTRDYPTELVAAPTESGFLAGLIPEEHGGSGLTMAAAAAIMEDISARTRACNFPSRAPLRRCARPS